MGWEKNIGYPSSNPIFSKLARVTYFQTMLVGFLRATAFQRCMACLWTPRNNFFIWKLMCEAHSSPPPLVRVFPLSRPILFVQNSLLIYQSSKVLEYPLNICRGPGAFIFFYTLSPRSMFIYYSVPASLVYMPYIVYSISVPVVYSISCLVSLLGLLLYSSPSKFQENTWEDIWEGGIFPSKRAYCLYLYEIGLKSPA